MWVFTIDGMYSANQAEGSVNVICVRARAKGDLERMIVRVNLVSVDTISTRTAIQVTPDRDYAFRVLIDRNAWERYLIEAAEAIDYSNFKNTVHAARDDVDRDRFMLRTWTAGKDFQEVTNMRSLSRKRGASHGKSYLR